MRENGNCAVIAEDNRGKVAR